MNVTNNDYISDTTFYIADYRFKPERKSKFLNLNPDENIASGGVIEINPCEGIYLSYANWFPKIEMERKYTIHHKFVKPYFLESGKITLVQNGKKRMVIQQGINLYCNKPSSGRVLYEANTSICYVSLLLRESYLKKLANLFPEEKFTFSDIFAWRTEDYNSEEISKIFIQIKEKMIAGISSSAYYEGKIFELLALIAQSHSNKEKTYLNLKMVLPHDELSRLECVRQAIYKSPLSPPNIETLCKIASMSQTKLRNLFKEAFGVSLGRYIQHVKLEYSLVLLSDCSRTISEIAKHLGYNNASKFSAAFKKYYNRSPSEYRFYKSLDYSKYN